MRYAGFVGGSSTPRSMNADNQRTVNWCAELIESGQGKGGQQVYLIGTPGLHPFVRFATAPTVPLAPFGATIRALWEEEGRAFAVVGGAFYEMFSDGTTRSYGSIAFDNRPASISSSASSGHQLFIVSGGRGYIFDLFSSSLQMITAPGFPVPARMGAYVDGYFVALLDNSPQINVSAPNDGFTWDPLDFHARLQGGDNIAAIIADHKELWLFGTKTTDVLHNTGDEFPLTPINGVFIEHGLAAPWGVCQFADSLAWLDKAEDGSGIVVRAQGYQPTRISTHPVELALGRTRLDDARAFSYQLEGHTFLMLYLPHAPTTWAFDLAVPPTVAWHERGVWNSGRADYDPWRGACHCYAFGKHLIGDPLTPTVYEMSLDFLSDRLVVPAA